MNNDDSPLTDLTHFYQRLDIDADADERAIKRAYARELKLIDQAADPAGFQLLRAAYDAALYMSRFAEATQAESEPADPFEELARAAKQMQLQPQALSAEPFTLHASPIGFDPDVDPDTLAQDVFAEFTLRCAKLSQSHDMAPWERELQASLSDPRLINIAARQAFEQRIADALADGWRPGHHVLLVVATNAFEWERDYRRLESLGKAGYTLQFAIDERATFDLQSDDAFDEQRRLIERVRDPAPPSTIELIDLLPILATVEARFPTWLSLIVDAGNIARWRHLDQSVPWWRRSVRKVNSEFPIWPFIVVVLVLLPILFSFASSAWDTSLSRANVVQHIADGNKNLDDDDFKDAVASFDRALLEDPDNADAYAGRALSLAFLFEKPRALADLKRLESLDPLNPLLFRTRGLLAKNEGRHKEAVAAYTRSLKLDPGNTWTRLQRGRAYLETGEPNKAMKDADILLKNVPGLPMGHRLRASVFIDRNDIDGAKAEAAAAILAADIHGEWSYIVASLIHQEIGDRHGALAVVQKAVIAFPKPGYHLNSASFRPQSHLAARRADLEAALALASDYSPALVALVELELQAKEWGNVIQAVDRALTHESTKENRSGLMTSRGIGHAKRGDISKADQDFEAARLATTKPVELNNLCYEMAVHNVALMTALANCDASLAQEPNAAHTLDSKAFTLLRMKRYAEALSVYDAALQANGKNAEAWYGRGVVKHRLRDRIGGKADIDSALALQAQIGAQFALMGLVP